MLPWPLCSRVNTPNHCGNIDAIRFGFVWHVFRAWARAEHKNYIKLALKSWSGHCQQQQQQPLQMAIKIITRPVRGAACLAKVKGLVTTMCA